MKFKYLLNFWFLSIYDSLEKPTSIYDSLEKPTGKPAHWFPRQMTSEKWAQKFHTDDARLPCSG